MPSQYSRNNPSRPTQQAAPKQTMPPPAGAGNQAPAVYKPQKLFEKFSGKFQIDEESLIQTLKATAFKQPRNGAPITNEQLYALLIVADQYDLNPFTKEIYAYPDKNGGIVPVVSIDGWIRIINEHPEFKGMKLVPSEATIEHEQNEHKWCFESMTVIIERKDREIPTEVTEYFDEVYRPPHVGKRDNGSEYVVPGPWQSHTKRMLRHKTIIQGGRVAFGFAGIYDEDEAQRILDNEERVVATVPAGGATRTESAKDALRQRMHAEHQPAGGREPQREQPKETVRQTAEPQQDSMPWDDAEQRSPQSDSEWERMFKGKFDSKDGVKKTWDNCIAWYTAENREVPESVEAEYTVALDLFRGASQ